jgi:hypothetical protein
MKNKGGRPKGSLNATQIDNIRAFACRVENAIEKANIKDSESIERIVCRLIVHSKNPAVQAGLIMKWAEWRYGPQKQHPTLEGKIEHIHTIEQVRERILELDRKRRTGVFEASGDGSGSDDKESDLKLLPGNGTTG